jgi:xeroderma pigmentosum group C-complementing protein
MAKVAKKLDIDFAEAIVRTPSRTSLTMQTGFEFKSRRAIPVVGGVVVAAENEEIVMDAWQAEEAMRVEREATKKQKEVLGRWKKFLVGLRIRQRINDVYGSNSSGSV